MKIEYKSKDNSYHVELEYSCQIVTKYYALGKRPVYVTQVLLKVNGKIKGLGEAVKHYQDDHNLKYACVYATKKIINKVIFKDVRKKLWNELFKKLNGINENRIKI